MSVSRHIHYILPNLIMILISPNRGVLCHAPGTPTKGKESPAHMTRGVTNVFRPEVVRYTVCQTHRVHTCPVCNSEQYIRRRVSNVVLCALKRMNIKKTMPVLTYLGAESWDQIYDFLAMKREKWNKEHPKVVMTLTNTALDHIKPVSKFKKEGSGPQTMLCNHYTNLQPLLHEDNNWKGEFWTKEDEEYWQHNIILEPANYAIYYPKSAPSQPSLLQPP